MAQTLAVPDTECVGNNFENLTVNDCGGRAFQVNDASCRNNSILGASFTGNSLGGLGEPMANLVTFREMAAR